MLTGEGLATLAIVGIFGKTIIGSLISFIVALGIAGHFASADIQRQKTVLQASLKYALIVNGIIWSVFALMLFANQEMVLLMVAIPIFAFIFCTN